MNFIPLLSELASQFYRDEESTCQKVNQSIKKSNKISIYSKKSTQSPQNHQASSIVKITDRTDFQALIASHQKQPQGKVSITNTNQMINKQVHSKGNNLSPLQGSFMTGVRTENKCRGVFVQISNPINDKQQDTMYNFMKCMQQQIYIAQQNYSKKFNQVLEINNKAIDQLHDKINRHEIVLKQKNMEIQKLKYSLNYQNKNFMALGQINSTKNEILQVLSKSEGSINTDTYVSTRIVDLQAKLKVLYNLSVETNWSQRTEKRIQILEKGFLNILNSKICKMNTKVQVFINKYSERLSVTFLQCQKTALNLNRTNKQSSQNNFSQNKIKQVSKELKDLQQQFGKSMANQFKCQNLTIYQLKCHFTALQLKLRQLESCWFQNKELVNCFNGRLFKVYDNSNNENKQNLDGLGQIKETCSKHSKKNPNISNISIDQLSNTYECWHSLQRLSPKDHPQSNNISNDTKINNQSMISISFSQQQSSSQHIKQQIQAQEMPCKYQHIKYELAPTGKCTKATNVKQATIYPRIIIPANQGNQTAMCYLPTASASNINKHSTVSANPREQNIRNLNQLRMQTRSPNDNQTTTKKSKHYLHKQNDKNSTSQCSISQIEDFDSNAFRDIINQTQTNDFSDDDEFFYPQKIEQQLINTDWDQFYPKVPSQGNNRNSQARNLQEISPVKKNHFISTQQNFYRHSKKYLKSDSKQNKNKKSDLKSNFMYNSSFDYQDFSHQDDQKQTKNYQNFVLKKDVISQTRKNSNLISNQIDLVEKCKNLNKFQFPVKMTYNRKKTEGKAIMSNSFHSLNGKSFILDNEQIQKLQGLGFLQLKTYI